MEPRGLKLLLDDRYAPITSCIGFLEVDHARAVEAFVAWQHDIAKPGGLAEQGWRQVTTGAARITGHREQASRPASGLQQSEVDGQLPHAIEALLPLTTPVPLRFLWVPTASSWTAYFDNSVLGTDASGPMGYLAQQLGCRAVRVVAVPDSTGTKGQSTYQRGGASMFTLFGPEVTDWLNIVRAISVSNDGRWSFEQSGTPQPFEQSERYKARRVRERFPIELLDSYCRALGLRPFDEDFYLPREQPTATLIERSAPANTRTFSLAEVQTGVPWGRAPRSR